MEPLALSLAFSLWRCENELRSQRSSVSQHEQWRRPLVGSRGGWAQAPWGAEQGASTRLLLTQARALPLSQQPRWRPALQGSVLPPWPPSQGLLLVWPARSGSSTHPTAGACSEDAHTATVRADTKPFREGCRPPTTRRRAQVLGEATGGRPHLACSAAARGFPSESQEWPQGWGGRCADVEQLSTAGAASGKHIPHAVSSWFTHSGQIDGEVRTGGSSELGGCSGCGANPTHAEPLPAGPALGRPGLLCRGCGSSGRARGRPPRRGLPCSSAQAQPGHHQQLPAHWPSGTCSSVVSLPAPPAPPCPQALAPALLWVALPCGQHLRWSAVASQQVGLPGKDTEVAGAQELACEGTRAVTWWPCGWASMSATRNGSLLAAARQQRWRHRGWTAHAMPGLCGEGQLTSRGVSTGLRLRTVEKAALGLEPWPASWPLLPARWWPGSPTALAPGAAQARRGLCTFLSLDLPRLRPKLG